MGILMNEFNKEELNVVNDSCFFVDENFFEYLGKLNNLYKKQEEMKTENERFKKYLSQYTEEREKLLTSQNEILNSLRNLLNEEQELYQKSVLEFNKNNINELNKKIDKLTSQKTTLGFKIQQLSFQLKALPKQIEDNQIRTEEIKVKIEEMKVRFQESCTNLNLSTLKKEGTINTEKMFLNVTDEKTRNDLVNLFKSNYKIETMLVDFIYKNANKFMQNKIDLNIVDVIQSLRNIIDEVYKLLFTFSDFNNIKETMNYLDILNKLINRLTGIIKSLINNKKIDSNIDDFLEMRNVSELRNRIVLKKCRPSFLFKRKIDDHLKIGKMFDTILSTSISCIERLAPNENSKRKVYFIN